MKKNLKLTYKYAVIPYLRFIWKYKNIHQVPKISSISINRGLGESSKNAKELNSSLKELSLITGQKPVINYAKKSIAGFKIRDGMPVGLSVTLRGQKMYDFLARLVHIALPRIRDFRGLDVEGFDGWGNYSLGIADQLIFPEISYDEVTKLRGLDITITTTATHF